MLLGVSALLLLVMTLTVGWQVWGRYALNQTPIAAEPLSLVFMLYLCLLGAAVGVREGFHMGMLVVLELLPPRGRVFAEVFSLLAVGGFALGMVWYGGRLVAATAEHVMPTVDISEGLFYFALPLSGAAIILFVVERLLAMHFGVAIDKDAYRDTTA
ncbi:TRAP transporter small permease [Ferrovibrio sp.]|uniref:TRAP transporter small permease n=1 Tax=Ferrovibrio sp. TaxID=1917215 RepID=UPI00311F2051